MAVFRQLAVHIADIFAAGYTATNPPIGRDFRNKVLGILDVVLEHLDHGGELSIEHVLGDRATLLAETDLLGMEEETLNIRIAATTGHEGNS